MRKIVLSLLLIVLLVGLALPASAQGDEKLIGPDEYPPGINPLTGLLVDDPTVLNQRPVIVKVVNAPAEARPQWGLPEADVVWEYNLAGGVTRFAAVYLSKSPERVGPVRSLRLTDFELTRIYRALMVTSGMSIGVREVLFDDVVMSRRTISGEDPCPALCRDYDLDRGWEYTLMGDVAALRELATERKRDTRPEVQSGMAFDASIPDGGNPVDSLQIVYDNAQIEWVYDPGQNTWLRFHDHEPHIDAISGEQLTADNIVVIEEEPTFQPFNYEDYWGYSNLAFSTNFIGKGRVVLLRDGQYFEGEWRRSDRDGGLYFYGADGQVLPFKPGRTYFQLVLRELNGYQLALKSVQGPKATVDVASVYFHWGPAEASKRAGWAYAGDQVPAIGRNNTGTWIQILFDDQPQWVSAELVTLESDVMALPVARPTVED